MATITTGIQLADNFSAPLMHIVSAVNMTISAMNDMNQSMNAGVNTASLFAARNEIAQATVAAEEFNQTMQQAGSPINDNIRRQEQFNQSLQNGASESSNLVSAIKRMAGAYLSIQTAGKILEMSDEITQTTSRLNMMNDGLQSTADLYNMVYVAANDARGSLGDMASVVARFGNNAKDAFSSSAEVVQFANLVQKQMTIAGASTQEAANAELQLSQALGSGVLRGDELNSIFEQAPNLIQNIADYLNVPIGKIRSMAQDGELSADVVKQAVFAATDEINANFENMPMTWGQMWTVFQNDATMAFQPVLQRLNDLANTDGFQEFATNAINDLAVVAGVVLDIFEGIGSIGTFVQDNWQIIGPVVYGVVAALAAYATYVGITNAIDMISTGIKITMCVASYAHAAATGTEASATAAATAAQYGLNTAMLSCPLTWIVVGIMALIIVLVALCNHFSGAGHIAQSTFGAICGGINVVIQYFKNWGLSVADIFIGIWNAGGACATNVEIAFHNAISHVQALWYNMLSTALTVVSGICSALNKLPFVDFDYSGITGAADNYASKAAAAAGNTKDYASVPAAFSKGVKTYDTYQKGWVNDAYTAGAAWGDGVTSKIKNTLSSKATNIPNANNYPNALASSNAATAANTADTAKNTAKTANTLSASSEDLKYLRDIADREYVNKFTTAQIKVEMINHNNVNNDMDLDGMAEHLRSKIEEEMNAAAEGEH
jgi:tape measure domain-containing protein|nr:MAG TPA: Tail tape measure [Caudoviricetes sp.]